MLLASSSKNPQKFASLGIILLLGANFGVNGNPIDTVITDLNSTVASLQVVYFQLSYIKALQAVASGRRGLWEYQKGAYSCEIRHNSVGKVESEILREKISIPDSNGFVTLWVSVILQETALIENGPVPSDEQVRLAIGSYHDNNSHVGDGSMMFWPQSYNSSMKQWYCNPPNMASVGRDVDDLYNFLHKVLDDLGLDNVWNETFSEDQRIYTVSLSAGAMVG